MIEDQLLVIMLILDKAKKQSTMTKSIAEAKFKVLHMEFGKLYGLKGF